jgi:hypothetical protein
MKCHRILVPVLALFFAAAGIAPAQDELKPEQQDSLNKILKRLDDMDRAISDSFRALRDDITLLKMEALKGQVTAEKVGKLEEQVKRLQTELDELRKQAPARPSFSVDPNKQTVEDLEAIRRRLLEGIARMERVMRDQQPRVAYSAPNPARLVLVNGYPETLTFVINGASYVVEPGGTRQIDNYPPGTINYHVVSSVWGARGMQSRTLTPGEVYTITAR